MKKRTGSMALRRAGTVLSLVALLGLVLALPVHAQSLVVKSVRENEVVLRNSATGTEVTLREGEEEEGLRVIKVDRDYITVSQLIEPDTVAVSQIPVKRNLRIHRAAPENDGKN